RRHCWLRLRVVSIHVRPALQNFSHTLLPRTSLRPEDHAPVGRERRRLCFATQCPTRHAPRLRAPTSRRNCARGRPSRAHCLALLFSSYRPRGPVPRFPKSRWPAAPDETCAAQRWWIFLLPKLFDELLKLFQAQSASCENLRHGACPATPASRRGLRQPVGQYVPA